MNDNYSNRHKFQCFWHIIFPFSTSIILVIFLGFLIFSSIGATDEKLRIWADIAFMIFTVPLLDLLIFIFVILILSIMLIKKSNTRITNLTRKAKGIFLKSLHITERFARALIKPLIWLEPLIRERNSNPDKGI